ncbi:MAG: N-6 DNA methylase, partial [Chloroflexota bacterium]|nr:N-6 DNA methylase [Chloroflexota bacterium]
MRALETYLRELSVNHHLGVKETSHYPAVANLLNEVGKALKPRVHCVIHPSSTGAGLPDGGFFTHEQLRRGVTFDLAKGALPARGVIEVKGTAEDTGTVAASPQVAKYLERYGQVLVTNLRDFVLIGRGADGAAVPLESYRLAVGEAAFWAAATEPHALAEEHGEQFVEYLKRVMLHAAPLASPQDVAWFLASYARDARARVERSALPALASVRTALEEALGLRFEGTKGEHFFRSTLVQTLFYGVFSAWVLWHKENPARNERFDWRMAQWYLRVPMIRVLFEQVATSSKLGPLGLVETLDWTAAALNRVDRAAFFARFEEEHAVQYFYEPFLEAFDPELRRDLGVWYTPTEIVRYMVARVDTVLREELDIPDGLADPRVYVLDPCCGTGAYLVEVLKRIAATLAARGGDALGGNDLKKAAMERVFGFEILPAPFVVAHLQLGLLLHNLGAPLSGQPDAAGVYERAGVYLTNALTGWEPPTGPKQHILGLPELEQERDAAAHVKRDTPILVILGNPPYNGFAGLAIAEERGLSTAYRVAKGTKQPQGQGLNDLYVRFYRMAERRIAETTGKGVVCFISNYSWLDGLSFTAMRERYLETFDHIWIDSLNGDKYKTGKLTPEGAPDPSIFATEWNREGIQVGTAIALLVRDEAHEGTETVSVRHLWGKEKRATLLATTEQDGDTLYQQITPPNHLGLPFMSLLSSEMYGEWPLLPDLFPVSFPGVKTSRDDVVVDIDKERLVCRMEQYFDPQISPEEMRHIAPGAIEDSGRFDAAAIRKHLQQRGFLPENIVRYSYRPFDTRWLYWEPETKLLDEKRSDYFSQIYDGNIWIEARQKQPMEHFDRGCFVRTLADNFGNGLSNYFPLYTRSIGQKSLFDTAATSEPNPNLSNDAKRYLAAMEASETDLIYSALALLHAPAYRAENAGALRQDWPRVPLPADRDMLLTSAVLGRQVAALLDTEQAVPDVT